MDTHMTEQEARAGLHILVAIAKADGRIDDREMAALHRALAEFPVPASFSLEAALDEVVDFDVACAAIESSDGRHAVFGAAVAMSMVDGNKAPEERALIDRLRAAFDLVQTPSLGLYQRILGKRIRRAAVQPIDEPELRRAKVHEMIGNHAAWSAVYGTLPMPVVDQVFVLSQQLQMLDKIAVMWGQPLNWKESLASAGVGIGLGSLTLAVASVLKIVPGWGSLYGAIAAYTTTYSLGVTVNAHFENQGKLTKQQLRNTYDHARVGARQAYELDKVRVESLKTTAKQSGALDSLMRDFETGKLTVEEYESHVESLHAHELDKVSPAK